MNMELIPQTKLTQATNSLIGDDLDLAWCSEVCVEGTFRPISAVEKLGVQASSLRTTVFHDIGLLLL